MKILKAIRILMLHHLLAYWRPLLVLVRSSYKLESVVLRFTSALNRPKSEYYNELAYTVSQWMSGLPSFISSILRYDVEVMDMKSLTTIEDTLGKINKILPPDFPVYLTLSTTMIEFVLCEIFLMAQIVISLLFTLFQISKIRSIDLDSMDPAFAPGTNFHEPGGLTSRFVLDLVEELSQKIGMMVAEICLKFPTLRSIFCSLTLAHSEVGADVIELCPKNDLNEMTAMVGAKITVRCVF